MQIEVYQTMNQYPTTRHESRQVKHRAERLSEFGRSFQGVQQDNPKKPEAAKPPYDSRFSKNLKVVVVGMVHDLSIVE